MGAACIKRCLVAIKKRFFGLPQRTLLPSRWTTVPRSVLSLHVQQSPLRIPLNPQNVQKLCRIVVNFHRCAVDCKKRRKHDGFRGIAWAQLAALLKKKTSTKNRTTLTVNHLKLYWSCKTHTWINRIFPRNRASQWGGSLCLLQKNSGKRQRKRSPLLIDENPVTQQISFFVGRPIGAQDLPEDDRPAETHLSFLSKQKLALPSRFTSLHTHQPPRRHFRWHSTRHQKDTLHYGQRIRRRPTCPKSWLWSRGNRCQSGRTIASYFTLFGGLQERWRVHQPPRGTASQFGNLHSLREILIGAFGPEITTGRPKKLHYIKPAFLWVAESEHQFQLVLKHRKNGRPRHGVQPLKRPGRRMDATTI